MPACTQQTHSSSSTATTHSYTVHTHATHSHTGPDALPAQARTGNSGADSSFEWPEAGGDAVGRCNPPPPSASRAVSHLCCFVSIARVCSADSFVDAVPRRALQCSAAVRRVTEASPLRHTHSSKQRRALRRWNSVLATCTVRSAVRPSAACWLQTRRQRSLAALHLRLPLARECASSALLPSLPRIAHPACASPTQSMRLPGCQWSRCHRCCHRRAPRLSSGTPVRWDAPRGCKPRRCCRPYTRSSSCTCKSTGGGQQELR